MDQMTENPFFAGTQGGIRRGWDAEENENALILRIYMPGLGKEDVKVSVEQNTLVIKGERAKEVDDEESVRYTSRMDLPEKKYKTNEIKAEMKNGVLKVAVPRVKEEERIDVFHVNVE
ncbi:heat shock 22 kDa protein, mitochondrial-like [Mangifera indica]|uniref:heat shock 22 kDa protein, mitochondrial-like n=1 Tax=Mangifera indica TaxID=29780 RepID=UPI001CFB6A0C|nr:heat shock 22 kDa protein, mitochondrial-like [Mangifera indica]